VTGPRVLVVDDQRDFARGVALVLGDLKASVVLAHSVDEAVEALEQQGFDLVLSDMKMPGRDGLSLLAHVVERYPRMRVILFTAYGTIEAAVDAMRKGAWDYLT
jgi:two-component system response regulator HydG